MGLGVYVMWGFFPLYFSQLAPAGSLEVIVHRAVWGMLSCLIVVIALRRWSQLGALIRDRHAVWRLTCAGFLIVINWTTYVFAVQSGHTVDAALGYYINPLVTVALARFVLKERLSRAQKSAITLGVIAVLVLVIGVGRLPWVSLVLALSFGMYSLVKKDVAHQVPPLEGMIVETAAVVPALLVYYAFLLGRGATSFQNLAQAGASSAQIGGHAALLVGAGILTMIPLLLFARAARGLPLAVVGLLQYINPSVQLLIGVAVFHETVEPARWIATVIIWCALAVLAYDGIRAIPHPQRDGKSSS